MNISGVLVQSRPERTAEIEAALAAMPGVEVHQVTEDGHLIVTIEDNDAASSGDTMLKMNLMDGVLAASLVYHHFEPDAEDGQPDVNANSGSAGATS